MEVGDFEPEELALVLPVGPVEAARATGAGDRDAVEGRVAGHLEAGVMPPGTGVVRSPHRSKTTDRTRALSPRV